MLKGTLYEKQIYEEFKSNYKNLYSIDSIPFKIYFKLGTVETMEDLRLRYLSYKDESICDRGFDLIGENEDGTYDVIQCKNYNRKIGCDDLGGFMTLLYVAKARYNNDPNFYYYIKGIVVSNEGFTDPLLTTFKNCNDITFRKIVYKEQDDYQDLGTHTNEIESKSVNNIEWRSYQIKALEEFKISLENGCKRWNLTLPCATGKGSLSFEMIKIYWNNQRINGTIYYFAPYKSNLSDLSERARSTFGSDVEIIRIHSNENDKSGIRITNEEKEIESFCRINKRKICFVCFDSCEKIIPYLSSNSFIIFDEFHDLSRKDLTSLDSPINEVINYSSYFLFMSATPRWYQEVDPKIYGMNIQTLSWKRAIKEKYINDFNIYLPVIENSKDRIFEDVDDKNRLKIEFLIYGLYYTGNRKTIVFCQDTKELMKLKSLFIELIQRFTSIDDFYIDYITAGTKGRKNIISYLRTTSKRSVIFSVRILDQCIDIPECDSIFFSSLSDNKIRNVQRISRSLRINLNKPKSAIFCWGNGDEEILDFLASLKEYDIDVESKIKCINLNLKQQLKERKLVEKKVKEKWQGKIDDLTTYQLKNRNLSLFYEFIHLREKIQDLKINHKMEYNKLALENGYTIEPDKKYKSYWKGWYNFLGISTNKYPLRKEDWIILCKKLGIDSYEKYQQESRIHNLPSMPEELYPSFNNFIQELGEEFLLIGN